MMIFTYTVTKIEDAESRLALAMALEKERLWSIQDKKEDIDYFSAKEPLICIIHKQHRKRCKKQHHTVNHSQHKTDDLVLGN